MSLGVESDQAKKVCHWMHDIIDCLYTTPPANFGVTSWKDNRAYLHRRVITFLVQFVRTFAGKGGGGGGGGGGLNAKSVGFWHSAPGPAGEAHNAPPDPLAGREGCPPPIPSPRWLRPLLCHNPCHTLTCAPPPPPAPNSWIRPCTCTPHMWWVVRSRVRPLLCLAKRSHVALRA